MLSPYYSENFKKQYKKLPQQLQNKFAKQLKFLLADFRHPSLRTEKMPGRDVYEARLDYHYRFVYLIIKNEVWIVSIGPHDEGLGKK